MLSDMLALRTEAKRRSSRRSRSYQDTPRIWRSALALDTAIVRAAGKLQVSGHFPDELRGRPVVLAANHIGNFDPLVLMAACRRFDVAPRFMMAMGILDAAVIGPFFRASGHLPVNRHDNLSALQQFADAADRLRSSAIPLIVYPEGRISREPGLWPERGKTGAARLALAAGAPLIPVSQWGAHEAVYWGTQVVESFGDLKPLIRSGVTSPWRRPTFKVHFGAPVDVSDLAADQPGSGMKAHRRLMRAITDGLVPLRAGEPDAPRFHDPTRPTDATSPWRPGAAG